MVTLQMRKTGIVRINHLPMVARKVVEQNANLGARDWVHVRLLTFVLYSLLQ